MAFYNDARYLRQLEHDNFHHERQPGWISPDSAIYRCVHCGDEITCNKGNPLPPQNHHQHNSGFPIRWKLVCVAETKA